MSQLLQPVLIYKVTDSHLRVKICMALLNIQKKISTSSTVGQTPILHCTSYIFSILCEFQWPSLVLRWCWIIWWEEFFSKRQQRVHVFCPHTRLWQPGWPFHARILWPLWSYGKTLKLILSLSTRLCDKIFSTFKVLSLQNMGHFHSFLKALFLPSWKRRCLNTVWTLY